MRWLGERPDVQFFGQGVANRGTSMSDTFDGVPPEKRIEMPVAEEMQVGMCIGMSLAGGTPVCVIPRWNFALRAADQIVNHMDALPIYSAGQYFPRVIVRVAAPSLKPFYPQAQHDGDFSDAFARMLRRVPIVHLKEPEDIFPAYNEAYFAHRSTIIVEYTEFYKNARAGHSTGL